MKSKTLKRCIAIVLCMVMVIGLGRGYLLAESIQSEIAQDGLEALLEGTTEENTDETVEVDLSEEDAQDEEDTSEEEEQETDEVEAEDDTTEEETSENVDAEEPILQLTYEDEKVKITVDAVNAGNIPEGATLSVTPIEKKELTSSMSAEEKEEAQKINEQYEATEQKLQEKAEEDENNLVGFLAYDITFVDAEGNKVEPNGDVKVSMEYKEAEIPEEVKAAVEDGQELDVTVMHLEENASGKVKEVVDMVADKNEEAEVHTTENQEVKAAEFTTDSFSIFTITWSGSYSPTLSAKVVDTNGNEIGNSDGYSATISGEKTISDLAQTIAGYEFVKAVASTSSELVTAIANGNSVNKIKYEYGWKYTTGNNTWEWLGPNKTIYFVYEKIKVDSVKIVDDIMESGALKAECEWKDDEKTITDYKWYRSDSENGTYTEVEKVDYQGDKSNLSKDGDKLYPAFDDGARKWYKVEVTIDNGDGTTSTLTSSPFQVGYYDELKNGSFETPEVSDEHSGTNNWQYSNENYKASNGVWQTTGTSNASQWSDSAGADIEIVTTEGKINKKGYGWNPDLEFEAEDGKQFAELNCEAAGALYQDVLTMEGTKLNYWLSHRARGTYESAVSEYDTMFLIIAPTKTVKNITTQSDLESYLRTLGVDYTASHNSIENEVVYNRDGVYVLRVTSDDQGWDYISKTLAYTPTASLTRFFFMSGNTASGNKTQGNFLDQVGFSQELPPLNDGEFTLQIEKKFEGLGNTNIESLSDKLTFTIHAEKKQNDGSYVKLTDEEVKVLFGVNTFKLKDMTRKVDGSYVYIKANQKIDVTAEYKVTITESGVGVDKYTVKTTTSTSISVAGGTPTTTSNAEVGALKEKVAATVTFTNKYEASNYKSVRFTKIWDDDSNKYETRPDGLTVTLIGTASYMNGDELTEKEVVRKTIALTKDNVDSEDSNKWVYTWKEVPVYYTPEGLGKVKIEYSVVEESVGGEYVYKSTTDGVAAKGVVEEYTYSKFEGVTVNGDKTSATNQEVMLNLKNRTALRVYAGSNTTTSTNNQTTLGEPAHKKYITYDESSKEYTLNLDVTGKKGSTSGVDVLFVIDRSGSMGSKYYNLLSSVQTLLTKNDGIIDKILKSEGNVNSVAYVSFSSMNGTNMSEWYTRDNRQTLKNQIDDLSANGGTNWTWAMMKASDKMAEKSSSGNEKVVIFLSDGNPTYTIKESQTWYGGISYEENGDGNNTKESYYGDAAGKVTGSNYLKNAKFYSVYLTSGTQSGMEKFNNKLKAGNVAAELVNGTALEDALTGILNKVIPTYTNVSITDTLSEYVDFAETDNVTVIVTKTTAEGVKTTLKSGTDYTATIDKENKKVTVAFNGKLEDGATYTMSFKVVPSAAANEKYNTDNGEYPNKGDANTGVTSAGKDGFYSNKNADTKVSYKIDGTDEEGEATYPMPVVQVTTHKLSYEKVWIKPDSEELPANEVTLKVDYTDGTTRTITLTEENGWKYEEEVPVTKNISKVTETTTLNDYTASYEITDNSTKAKVTNSYSKVTSSNIHVKKVWKNDSEATRTEISVTLWQSTNDGASTKYETVKLSKDNNWEHTWSGLKGTDGSGENIITYSYAVTEDNIPENYSSNITYTTENDTTNVTITNVYDENCADEEFHLINVLQTEKWTIQKIWDDQGVSEKRPSSLDVTVNGKVFTLTGSGTIWEKEIVTLKKKDISNDSAEEHLSGDVYKKTNQTVSRDSKGDLHVSFTNTLETKSITVKKVWNNGGLTDNPTIKFKLYRISGEDKIDCGYFELNEENEWSTVISGLPIIYEYTVEEILTDETGYDISIYHPEVTVDGDAFTITNTLTWSAKKVSAPWSGQEESVALEGAEFELKDSEGTVIATGESDENGDIKWTLSEGVDLATLNGTYTIVETKAPEGYMIRDGGWKLEFTNGLLTKCDGKGVTGTAENGVVIELQNQQLYELPSTGGSGIYWYMIGGVMLMMAAALVLYKKRCEEVLSR